MFFLNLFSKSIYAITYFIINIYFNIYLHDCLVFLNNQVIYYFQSLFIVYKAKKFELFFFEDGKYINMSFKHLVKKTSKYCVAQNN